MKGNNEDRLEALFSVALEALYDIQDSINSPTAIWEIIHQAQTDFAHINLVEYPLTDDEIEDKTS